MLNLFKLPFRGKNRSTQELGFSSDLSTGLLTGFIKNKKDLSGEEFDHACDVTAREMTALQLQLQKSGSGCSYDLMAAALRRIEEDLNR